MSCLKFHIETTHAYGGSTSRSFFALKKSFVEVPDRITQKACLIPQKVPFLNRSDGGTESDGVIQIRA